jgi:hypothetical protein
MVTPNGHYNHNHLPEAQLAQITKVCDGFSSSFYSTFNFVYKLIAKCGSVFIQLFDIFVFIYG